MIVLAGARDEFGLEVATDLGEDDREIADRQVRQHVAAVFGDEDQVRVQRVNDVSSPANVHVAAPETNLYGLRMIARGFRFKLCPTAEQAALFWQFAGVCRLVYNLALEQRRDWWRHIERETGQRLNYVAQARQLTDLRAEFDWIRAV